MPEWTFMQKEVKSMSGFKAFMDWITILLGGKVAGYKLKKPFAICHSENPRTSQHVSKPTLQMHCKSHRCHRWLSSSFKMPLWIPVGGKWSTIWRSKPCKPHQRCFERGQFLNWEEPQAGPPDPTLEGGTFTIGDNSFQRPYSGIKWGGARHWY